MKKNVWNKQGRKNLVDSVHRKMEKLIVKSNILIDLGIYINQGATLKEFQHLPSEKNYNFISVGCGSFPWSLIILSRKNNWMFTGIDHDSTAVRYANIIIDKFHLSRNVTIYYDDAENHDFSKYDIILFSFGVEPRKEIFNHIIRTMKKQGIIIFRTTWESLNSIYIEDIIPKELIVRKIQYRYDGIKSLTLERKTIEE